MSESKKALPGWREIPDGGLILEAGNAKEYRTGDWRSNRPIFDAEQCIAPTDRYLTLSNA